MGGRVRYIAYLSADPDKSAGFYARHLGLEEIGRSNQGDVSLTDGFMNLTFLKARDELCEPDVRLGLHHVGLQVDNMDKVLARYGDVAPRGEMIEESGGPHFGDLRVYDPECHAVSLSTGDFGVGGEARNLPRVAHVALNALDPTLILQFYESLFGFREISASFERREQDRKNRFFADGFTNFAVHPFYNGSSEGHEQRFGMNHIGFLVGDMDEKLDGFAREIKVEKRPESRPYAEYRLEDPDGNKFDLSYKKGWEVDVGRWENGGA